MVGAAVPNRRVVDGVNARSARLTDEQWEVIKRVLPGNRSAWARNNEQASRNFVESVLWTVAGNRAWGEIPYAYGSPHAAYVRFLRWNEEGVWDMVATVIGPRSRLGRALLFRAKEQKARLGRGRGRWSAPRMI